MRVALAYPYGEKADYQCSAPMALLYLASALARRGVDVRVFDQDGYDGGRGELIAEIARTRPDILGIPLFSELPYLRGLRDTLRALRPLLPRTVIVAGGPHPTACPEETLRSFPEVDYLLRGEADMTLPDLVRQLEGNVARPCVGGIGYRENGDFVLAPLDPPPQDLDELPIPDRAFLWDNYRRHVYWRLGRKAPADIVITSRGCPFRCRFCFKVEEKYRTRGPASVVEELVYLTSLGITTVDLEDDLFTARKSRCLEICRGIRDAGLKLDLKVRSHVRTIDEEILDALKQSGVHAVVYGIESGSDVMLRAMNKKATVADNYRAIRLTKKAGLMCHADLFVGFPGETWATLAETRRFLRRARPTAVTLGMLVPYPGTAVFESARQDGVLTGDWSPEGPQPFVRLPWAGTPAVLQREIKRMMRSFYLHPAVLLALARRLAFHMDAASWRGAFRYLRRLLPLPARAPAAR